MRTGDGQRKPPAIAMRPATLDDYAFALALYLNSTKPLLTRIGRWDEERIVSRFKRAFKVEQVQIICVDGNDIGWTHIADSADKIALEQIHLVSCFCEKGIGTMLIKNLLTYAKSQHKPVTLNVMRGNRALELYKRLGFRVTGHDLDKLQMISRA